MWVIFNLYEMQIAQVTFSYFIVQKNPQNRIQADCEKLFHLAVKRSGGISTALKFSLRTLKECHYYQVLLHVFWHKLISLCCFMLAHFVQQTLRNFLSSSISLLISCFFPKIRKLLCLNHCLS